MARASRHRDNEEDGDKGVDMPALLSPDPVPEMNCIQGAATLNERVTKSRAPATGG